ncbi:hypothetical protein ACFOTA_08265 [Chitinophaga sp. GCM10012297]|uniref:Secreted protein n=1 Tax=Chitinophaga chungangae TaxID=2821488 RepID=A0ABS3YBY4_9BACT|nr:hypothetical protein [Chitinophaga chungangae]MBO9152197.1 hypothetical protein [Chitinophaga chungangae]
MKSKLSKVVVAAVFVALLLMNVGVSLTASSQSKKGNVSAMLNSDDTGDSNSDSNSDTNGDTGGGSQYKYCGLDECEIKEMAGIPPYTYEVTLKGHYMHCKLIQDASKNCSSSVCDEECDASNDTD